MSSIGYNPGTGLQGMLKSGHRHMEGTEASVIRNVEATKQLSRIVRSSLGPNGMNKLVVNHLEKIVVTSDCSAILKELEIEHPAARMLQMAADAQDERCGDGTNLCVSFAGELLTETEGLLRMGLHPSEIIVGYKKAADLLLDKILPSLVFDEVKDTRDEAELIRVVKPVLGAKQFGSEDVLAPLVVRACLGTMNRNASLPKVYPDSVRVVKILGGDVGQSSVIQGMAVTRGAETSVISVENAKIVVFGCGIEASSTEAKGTVLMENADDLKGYNKSEEKKMDEVIKSLADSGVTVVVSGGTVSEMALHFIERYGMMCVKFGSKWDLRRLCSAVNATALVRLGPPTPEEMGECRSVSVKMIGERPVTVFDQSSSKTGRLSTIILRASTQSLLQDLERAVEDGVRACQMVCVDPRLLPGAGATELECAIRVREFGDALPGLDQYAVRAFSDALQFVPKTLCENSGKDPTDVLAVLSAKHAEGKKGLGVDILDMGDGDGTIETGMELVDLAGTKISAFRLAVDAALTVLRVDQIIMSKQAGGGKGTQ